jgi:hypothetical protein
MNGFYGDDTRWFVGSVINNNDNEFKLGRVQVRIYGIHDNLEMIQNKDLPWAQVMAPSTEDGTSGLGFKPNLKNGAQVFGLFLDGKMSQAPLILGSIPKIEIPTTERLNRAIKDSKVGDTKIKFNEKPIETITNQPNINEVQGATHAEKSFNFFIANGFTAEQSAGIVGNLCVESTSEMNPEGKGIAQWSQFRYRLLTSFAAERNLEVAKLETQLQYIVYDLNKNPSFGLSQLKSAKNVVTATSAFGTRYLRVGSYKFNDDYPYKGDKPIEQKRIDFAEDAFNRFK